MKYKCHHKNCKQEPSVKQPNGDWDCWKHWEQHCDKSSEFSSEDTTSDLLNVMPNSKLSNSSVGDCTENTPNVVLSSTPAGETQRRLR